jgi:hypothetical protein
MDTGALLLRFVFCKPLLLFLCLHFGTKLGHPDSNARRTKTQGSGAAGNVRVMSVVGLLARSSLPNIWRQAPNLTPNYQVIHSCDVALD